MKSIVEELPMASCNNVQLQEDKDKNPDVTYEAQPMSTIANCDLLESEKEHLDDPDLFPEGGFQAYMVVVGSFFGLIGVLAFVNSAGVMENYVKEHILDQTPTSTIAWIFAVSNFLGFGGTVILGPIFDRVGARIPIAIGTVLTTLGIMCMSVSTQFYQFFLSYGIAMGLGTAFTFGPFVGVVSHYFYKKRGQTVGLAYIGGAVGGLCYPLIFLNLYPKIGYGWTIRIMGFLSLSFLSIGLVMVKDRKHVFNEIDANASLKSVILDIVKSIDLTCFKDKTYTMLVLTMLGNGFAFLVTLTYLPSYAVECGFPASKSYLLLTVFNAFSIPGRLVPGYLADNFGAFNTLCGSCSLSTLTFVVIWLPHPIGHSIVGLFIFAGMYGFASGSLLSLTPTCIGVISKTKDFGKRSGTAFLVLSCGDLFGIVIGGAIIGKGSILNYDHLVIFVVICSLFGTIGACIARYFYAGIKMVKA